MRDGGSLLVHPEIGSQQPNLPNSIPIEEIERYLMHIDEETPPNIIFETLKTLRDRHSRKRIMDVQRDFVDFYGGKDTPLKFFYFPRESGGTPTTWNDCYVGMSLPVRPYSRLRKAVEELGNKWAEGIYDIEDTRLRFDDKTNTVFIKVANHYKFVVHVIT